MNLDNDQENLPNSHTLFNVCRSNIIGKIHNKLGELLHIDDVFRIIRISIDDFGTSSNLAQTITLSTHEILVHLAPWHTDNKIEYTWNFRNKLPSEGSWNNKIVKKKLKNFNVREKKKRHFKLERNIPEEADHFGGFAYRQPNPKEREVQVLCRIPWCQSAHWLSAQSLWCLPQLSWCSLYMVLGPVI